MFNTVWKVSKYEVFLLCKCPYSVRIRENTDQKKLRIWTLFTHNLASWNTTDFTYYLSYIIAVKNFPRFKTPSTHLLIDLNSSNSLLSQLLFRKESVLFLFLSAMSRRQESTTRFFYISNAFFQLSLSVAMEIMVLLNFFLNWALSVA